MTTMGSARSRGRSFRPRASRSLATLVTASPGSMRSRGSTPPSWCSLAVGVALAALGVFAEWAALQRAPLQEPVGALDLRLAAADLATGLVLAASGLIAWTHRPDNRTGLLLTATSAAWFLGTFAESGLSGYADFGSLFISLHRGPL